MAILTDDMKRVIREQSLGFVATVCPDGTPNLSPKGTLSVWDDETLIFADLASPTTVANILANPGVEVNVVDPLRRKGYRFKGRASVHHTGPLFDQAVHFFDAHGVEESRIHGVVVVLVQRAVAVLSPAYARGMSEAEIVDRFARRVEAIHGWKIERQVGNQGGGLGTPPV
jgi:predicted pyridoxine 5'-phosphate oxidase superfamily flavin-nucleotide-binding protein